MSTHQRHSAGRADRRITLRCRSVIVIAFSLALLATACGAEQAADSAGTTPAVSQQFDDAFSKTVEAVDAIENRGDDHEVADYTDAELEILLDVPSADTDTDTQTPEHEPLEATPPAAAIEAIEAELDEAAGTIEDTTPILDKVQPLDDAPTTAAFGIRDGRRINEAGEALHLDEAAALACANAEIALTALDEGRSVEAAAHLQAASDMTVETAVSAMNPWSSILEQTAVDVAASELSTSPLSKDAVSELLAFLTTCTQGGYEL